MDLSYWANLLRPPLLFFPVSFFLLAGTGWFLRTGIGGKLGIFLFKAFLIGACISFVLFFLEFVPALAG